MTQPRRSTAITEPPDIPTRIVKRLATWKVIGAATGTVLGLIVAGVTWKASLVSKEDLDRARGIEAGERAADLLATQTLRDRVLRVETDMAWLKAAVYEISHVTGARNVPPPPP
jgi:hypothetical protein